VQEEEEGTIALMLFHWNIHKTLTLGEEQLTTIGFSGIITHKALVTKFLEAQLRTSCRKTRQKANPKKKTSAIMPRGVHTSNKNLKFSCYGEACSRHTLVL
jgi:hypothetical protein